MALEMKLRTIRQVVRLCYTFQFKFPQQKRLFKKFALPQKPVNQYLNLTREKSSLIFHFIFFITFSSSYPYPFCQKPRSVHNAWDFHGNR